MPTLYSGTFGAVPFRVRISNVTRTTESEFTIMHIPGGDVNVIDMGGPLHTPMTYELYFAKSSDYELMVAKVGTADGLQAYDFTGTVYLKSLTRNWVNPLGEYPTLATAEFIA